MNHTPIVSVIIPSYNHAIYLRERIDSVINQSFQDFELIILDDASTDHSTEIIETYRSHPKITHILFNDTNSGSLFKQWQKGIELSTGKYIWIAESDDVASESFLRTLYPILENDSDISFVYADSNVIDSHGNLTGKNLSDKRNVGYDLWTKSYIKDGRQQLNETLLTWCSVNNASAVLFNASKLKNLDLDLGSYLYAGDWAVYISLAFHGKIAYVHKQLSNYREHPKNASKKSFGSGKLFIDHFRIFNYCTKQLSKIDSARYISRKSYVISEGFIHTNTLKFIEISLKMFLLNPILYTKAMWKVIYGKTFGKYPEPDHLVSFTDN